MVIGGVDVTATKKKRKGKQMEDERIKNKMVKTDADTAYAQSRELLQLNSISSSSYTDMDAITLEYESQNCLDFPTLARERDLYGISDRAAASIASAASRDIGIVHEGETSHVVDRNKICRQSRKLQNAVAESTKLTVSQYLLTGLYFDGRKGKTKVLIKKDTKYYPKTMKEEHYTLVNKPNSVYIGHVTTATGGAIKEAILNFFASNNMQLNGLKVIGWDGTNVNTGHKGGIIRLMELDPNTPSTKFFGWGNYWSLQNFVDQLVKQSKPVRSYL
ncbi:hypothetical protein AVEN_226661-1 [Araneus ventricosus]|uniref:Uncharacterized protein n=1 Tax=Araneus ventricosus TaxID=182803 RepID=A0A4Y2J3D2_ARAVE|nr:hypothetical protein AVEN_226661-1 [Araneus ventricosus]